MLSVVEQHSRIWKRKLYFSILDYRIDNHERLFFPNILSTLDTLIWSVTLINKINNKSPKNQKYFQSGRVLQAERLLISSNFHGWTFTPSSRVILIWIWSLLPLYHPLPTPLSSPPPHPYLGHCQIVPSVVTLKELLIIIHFKLQIY